MKVRAYTIYKAVNIVNNKVYVGFDSNWPARKKTHMREARTGWNKCAFHSAILKYGEHSFCWDILHQSQDGVHTLNVMEAYFINKFNSFAPTGHGYNMTLGGDGVTGRVPSNEVRSLFSKKYSGAGNPFYGKTHTAETKKLLSKIATGKIPSEESLKKRSISVSIAKSQKWILFPPNGDPFEVVNLKLYSKENKLNYGNLLATNRGERSHSQGWRCKNAYLEKHERV